MQFYIILKFQVDWLIRSGDIVIFENRYRYKISISKHKIVKKYQLIEKIPKIAKKNTNFLIQNILLLVPRICYCSNRNFSEVV